MDSQTLRSVLDRLNNNYGRGRITDVTPVDSTTGTFIRVPFQCRPEKICYRIIGKDDSETVVSMRHSITVPR